jgi:hypothetical protein
LSPFFGCGLRPLQVLCTAIRQNLSTPRKIFHAAPEFCGSGVAMKELDKKMEDKKMSSVEPQMDTDEHR